MKRPQQSRQDQFDGADDKAFFIRNKQREESYTSQFKGNIEQTYREYIASRHWTARKEQFYKTHPKQCALCGSTSFVELNHIYYGNFGFEKDEDLIALCSTHHQALHAYIGVHKDMRYATADFIEWQRDLINKERI